jgi:hypothetical protein
MKNKITRPFLILSTLCLLAVTVIGCKAFQGQQLPPSVLQSQYDIQTNIIFKPITVFTTNVVPVTVTQTNNLTNTTIVQLLQTNVTQVPVIQSVTNYTLTPNSNAQATASTVGTVTNAFLPGSGALATQAALGVLALVGWFYSAKNKSTAGSLTQIIEVARNILKAQPNGTALDQAFVNWMQQHQTEAGVIQNVASLIASNVNTPAAQGVATQLQSLISASNTATAPTPAKV